MTTAHRPTFDPARGKEAQRGVAYHQRLLPAHTQLKTRKPGQGGDADAQPRNLRAQLLEAEAAHFNKGDGTTSTPVATSEPTTSSKRQLEAGSGQDGDEEEDIEAKRRRVLEETRHIDADSDDSSSASSEEDSDEEEEDETAELLRELEKIKKERAEKQAEEDRVKAAAEQEDRERDIALGNPLLNPHKNSKAKRRWDDDVVFRNQARGTENKGKKEFVNDLLRSDFHKRFMLPPFSILAIILYGSWLKNRVRIWNFRIGGTFDEPYDNPCVPLWRKRALIPTRVDIDMKTPNAQLSHLDRVNSLNRISDAIGSSSIFGCINFKNAYRITMPVFLRQVWTLVQKDLLVAAVRRPISTSIRAVILPLAIVLVIAYAQYFFNPSQHFGVGQPRPALALPDAIARSSGGRNTIAFVDNGLTNGDISAVIEDVAAPFRKAGKSVFTLAKESDLLNTCPSSQKGTTSCFGAVVFHSSPKESSNGGAWNYTIRSDTSLGGHFDVTSSNNDAQIYLIPLQRALDLAIASRTSPPSQGALQDVQQYPYTKESEEKRQMDTRMSYLDSGISYFGVVFFLGMVGVVYQMTGLIASEREHGLSQLIDAMMPNLHRWQPQLVRLFAHHAAFSVIYLPSWLATGIVLASLVFVKSSAAITIFYHLTAGLALCSYALVGAAFLKKAQLSGIIMTVIAVVLAVIPQVLDPKRLTPSTVLALSLIFPSSNYTFFLTFMARWEVTNKQANLYTMAPESPWKLHGAVLWAFLVLQIFLYPIFAVIIERTLWGTASKSRTVHSHGDPTGPTVQLRNFNKTYKQHWFPRLFWKRKADVQAVKSLSLNARKGQILMLLGPNGSGKSTTLDAVAGLSRMSSGCIDIDGTGGLGIAPQKNVLWDELTVEEHVKIMYSLKAASTRHTIEDLSALVQACDLVRKRTAKSKTLSGGQKRKLQLAMMFAGGSSVCCVDEVSSGLDPLSRRKIWDILLAKRRDRTIIMTTHFLDEADFLSDHIAILSTGHLKAEGSSAGLKHQYGEGYNIHVPTGILAPDIQGLERKETLEGTAYAGLDPMGTAHAVNCLEKAGINGFRISGPTLEHVFLKLAGNPLHPEMSEDGSNVSTIKEKPKDGNTELVMPVPTNIHLHGGKRISPLKQGWILYQKRWMILRRNYVPMLVMMAIAIIGAGVCPIFLKYLERMDCSVEADDAYTSQYPSYVESLATNYHPDLVGGPSVRITDRSLAGLADIYRTKHTRYGSIGSINDTSDLEGFISTADTYQDFSQKVALGNATISPGGFWLGDGSSKPTFAWSADPYDFATSLQVQNILNNMLYNGTIAASFSTFDIPEQPQTYDFLALIFVIYYCLVLCLYPGFYAQYPTVERLRDVRALQYSNGVRSLPLWLAYVVFDLGFTLVISAISTALLSVGSKSALDLSPVGQPGRLPFQWYHLPYLFLILLLYGISSSILSYLISMFARSQLAAWAFCASGQVVVCLGYFGAYLGVQTNVGIGDLTSTLDRIHFTIGLVSPIANVMRSLFVALNQFTLLCGNKSNPGAIELYGAPILYLILQIFVFFAILLWWDSGVSPLTLIKRNQKPSTTFDMEGSSTAISKDIADEIACVRQVSSPSDTGLRVLHLNKSFRKNKAVVDDLSFKISQNEVFALLGPNGAGKSTAISLIRGDIPPTKNPSTKILAADTNILTHRAAARHHLGTCPQHSATDTLTVSEALQFYARIRGLAPSSAAHNISTLLTAFNLDAHKDKLSHALSGGYKRKLSIAIALVGNPAVLLLDEPSSGLDARAKRELWNVLRSVKVGRAILLTTHSMEEADALGDRAGIMSRRMLTVGKVEELRDRWGGVVNGHLVLRSAPYSTMEEVGRVKEW
ncbi:MAG: hypothetical protein Q9218_004507, partial [Villophora microphyllina]